MVQGVTFAFVSASLATKEKEPGAEEGHEAGGRFGDLVPHDLNSVDGGDVGDSGDVESFYVEHGGGEAIETDVVPRRGGLAVDVGVEASHAESGNELIVEIAGGAGAGEIDLGGGSVGAGVAVDKDIVVGPTEGTEIDAGDANGGGNNGAGRIGLAGDVAFHHEVVTGSWGASSDDGAGGSDPEEVDEIGGGGVGLGQEAGVPGGRSPLVGGDDSGNVGGDEGSALKVAQEVDRSGGDDDGLAGGNEAEGDSGGGQFGGAGGEEAALAGRAGGGSGLESGVRFPGTGGGDGLFDE